MITKEQYEEMMLDVKAMRHQLELLIKEAEVFIRENLYNESKQAEVRLVSEGLAEYQKLDADYKEVLFDLHYRYNTKFAKPSPSKPAV